MTKREQDANDQARNERIVIVGPCASGKSTLAANLRRYGYDVHVSGQEHSEISGLWQRQEPDVLVALTLDLETVRVRRGDSWSRSLYETQLHRLRDAYAAADLVIDTSRVGEEAAVARVLAHIEDGETSARHT